MYFGSVTDTQVVAHVLRAAVVHHRAAGHARDPAAQAPPHPPRCAARDVLLHHDGLAQLPAGGNGFLAGIRGLHHQVHGTPAARRRHGMGKENHVERNAVDQESFHRELSGMRKEISYKELLRFNGYFNIPEENGVEKMQLIESNRKWNYGLSDSEQIYITFTKETTLENT